MAGQRQAKLTTAAVDLVIMSRVGRAGGIQAVGATPAPVVSAMLAGRTRFRPVMKYPTARGLAARFRGRACQDGIPCYDHAAPLFDVVFAGCREL